MLLISEAREIEGREYFNVSVATIVPMAVAGDPRTLEWLLLQNILTG